MLFPPSPNALRCGVAHFDFIVRDLVGNRNFAFRFLRMWQTQRSTGGTMTNSMIHYAMTTKTECQAIPWIKFSFGKILWLAKMGYLQMFQASAVFTKATRSMKDRGSKSNPFLLARRAISESIDIVHAQHYIIC